MTEESRIVAVCPHCHSTCIFHVELREVLTTRIVEVEGEGDEAEFVLSGETMIHREAASGLPEFIQHEWYACMDCRYEFPRPATARVGEVREPRPNPRLPEAFRNLLRGEGNGTEPDSPESVRSQPDLNPLWS